MERDNRDDRRRGDEDRSKNPQIYIGGINRDVSTSDIRKKFEEFGNIANLSIKNRYAFVVSTKNVFSHKF